MGDQSRTQRLLLPRSQHDQSLEMTRSTRTSPRSRYAYEQLDKTANKIRLVTLLPGEDSDIVRVNIHETILNQSSTPEYEALSYEWGSQDWSEYVEVTSSFNGTCGAISVVEVTPNLASALRHLRSSSKARTMWIDAICIHQKDLSEREHQVTLMSNIFRAARGVILWLGPEADDSNHAMELLRSMGTQIDPDWKEQAPWTRRDIDSLSALLNRNYFNRLWIRQEIAFGSPQSLIVCGYEVVPWQDFRSSMPLISTKSNNENLKNRAMILHTLCNTDLYVPFFFHLEFATMSKCKDDRDRIYALLAFKPRFQDFRPDYTKDLHQVYEDIVISELKFGSTKILNSTDLSLGSPGLPSFVRDWRKQRCYKDDTNRRPHWAGYMVYIQIRDYRPGRLTLTGVHIDKVKYVWPSVTSESHITFPGIRSWHDLSPDASRSNAVSSDEIIRALCRSISVARTSHSYLPARSQYPSMSDVEGKIRPQLITPNNSALSIPGENGSGMQSVFQTCYNRSLYLTENGSYGLGPRMMQPGDDAVVFLGCDFPFILRQHQPSAELEYKLVGICYLDGYMNGQSLFGKLPTNLEPILEQNNGNQSKEYYRDQASGKLLHWKREDPRIISLLEKHLSQEEQAAWKAGTIELTPEHLTRFGVRLTNFPLI